MTRSPVSGLGSATLTKGGARTTFTTAGDVPDSVHLAENARRWPAAYVHIPFCARVCPYCDFAVMAGRDDLMGRYVKAVATEIGREQPWHPLASVYVGGGTPSRVPPALLGSLLEALSERFGIEQGAEVSLEANPEDWTPAHSDQVAERGFERVSFGSQSFDPGVLASLGRRHRPEQIAAAVVTARRSGFRSINLDLIFGTPGETAGRWEATLDQAVALEPDHVSCYALTVEPGTELGRAVAAGAPAPDSDLQADFYEMACETLGEAGLVRYEVSNWARPGHAARYNLAVWGQAEYLAFGMGAHRFRDGLRSHNRRLLDGYLTAVEGDNSPTAGHEVISGWAAEVERVFLGIRRVAGVVAGAAGTALMASEDGQRLAAAGVIDLFEERLTVLRPLLTDHVARALLALAPQEC
jgi:putative oxygen-independent coproporphyrinogen III oxidase